MSSSQVGGTTRARRVHSTRHNNFQENCVRFGGDRLKSNCGLRNDNARQNVLGKRQSNFIHVFLCSTVSMTRNPGRPTLAKSVLDQMGSKCNWFGVVHELFEQASGALFLASYQVRKQRHVTHSSSKPPETVRENKGLLRVPCTMTPFSPFLSFPAWFYFLLGTCRTGYPCTVFEARSQSV